MSIIIKSAQEIEKMRVAGRLAADVLQMIAPHVKVGVTTKELDELCHNFITQEQEAIPAPLDYHGYPGSVCTSINHVICHGIPDTEDKVFVKGNKTYEKPAILKDGDILNIDVTVIKDGYHGDSSQMFLIGNVTPENKRLCRVTQESMYEAIRKVKPGAKFSEIGATIQKHIKKAGARYSIVKDYCGHGIGAGFHEEPQVVHYKNFDNRKMQAGMCFTIEPMINAGRYESVQDSDDGWTAYTIDSKNTAQYEHTILVTEAGCEVLTLRDDEKFPRFVN